MGTRSVTKFQEDGQTLVAIYQQFDGYPEVVGKEIFDFLNSITMVNGIPAARNNVRYANGVGCLAAQFIADHKYGGGGFYVTVPEDSQEFNYTINYPTKNDVLISYDDPIITVDGEYNGLFFNGSLEEFGRFIDSFSDEENEVA